MRNYKRKTNRGMVPHELMMIAALEVMEQGKKLRQVARELNVGHMTLRGFINKLKSGEIPKVGYKSRQFFTKTQEREIANHLIQYARIFFGLTNDQARKLAYQCVVRLEYSIPSGWEKNGSAGREWMNQFMSRNPQIRIRPQKANTKQSKQNINEFFNMLFKLLEEYKFLPTRIYHLVDYSITPLKRRKTTSRSISVSIGQGSPVNMLLAANASGETIPPMFVMPIADCKPQDGPDSLIVENESGEVTTIDFLTYIDHLILHTKPNPSDPILFLLKDYQYVVDVNVLDKARNNSIILLSFPPYCAEYCIEPLEVIASKFKRSCKMAQVEWLEAHPKKSVARDKIPKIVGKVLPSESDIKKGFRDACVWPFRPSKIIGEEFVPSAIEEPVYYDTKKLQAQTSGGSSSGSSRATSTNVADKLDTNTTPEDPLKQQQNRDLYQCRFCAGFAKNCVDVTVKDRPYSTQYKTALTLNDLSVELDFNDDSSPKTVCRVCDRKLQEMYDFIKQVKEAQDLLIVVRDDVKTDIETIIVKIECESPTDDKELDDSDDNDSKDEIIDSITVTETEFVKPIVNLKRKNVEVTAKTQKKLKVTKEAESANSESMKVIKNEKSDELNDGDAHAAEKMPLIESETDNKPSEFELTTSSLVKKDTDCGALS